MIDLHFHCLPGIDDGPDSWPEAVALCRAAAAEGTTHVVATPHVLRDPWLNESREERQALLAELNVRLAGAPVVLPGCEYFFASNAVELWELGERGPLVGLNGSSHLLIEFPARELPRSARAVIHELVVAGVTPVIAHPERNAAFTRNLDDLGQLVALGARTQVTAASITGEFGQAASACAERIIEAGLAHVVASDAHNLKRRPPRMAEAKQRVLDRWGEATATSLFHVNPASYAAV